ncbi:MAG: hypothetical protein LUF89_03970 [Ruminococcus sp.]|nr:hypothetical protein [Ruminococcus sp.]
MSYCKKCGKKLENDVQCCAACQVNAGVEMSEEEFRRLEVEESGGWFCPVCGFTNMKSATRCLGCGYEPDAEERIALSDPSEDPLYHDDAENTSAKVPSKAYTLIVWLCIIGIAVGVFLMIMAIVLGQAGVRGSAATLHDSSSFGGDFYTYIYKVVVNIKNSIWKETINSEAIVKELGCLIGGFGAMLSLLSGMCLCHTQIKKSHNIKQEQQAEEQTKILGELRDFMQDIAKSK